MGTILVVDDRPSNREFLVTLLGYQGHRLLEAADGAEALQCIRSEHADLVITDILMPTMDGYEFVRQLRTDPAVAATPVIFASAHYLEREARALARRCGVAHILVKPIEPEDVLRAVDDVLRVAPSPPAVVPAEEFDREHLRLLTDKLSQKNEDLKSTNLRLAAIIELNQELGLSRDPVRILERLCHAARDIIGTRYSAVAIFDEHWTTLRHFFTSGLDATTAAVLAPPVPDRGLLAQLHTERAALRRSGDEADAQRIGLPQQYPPAPSLLAVPIASLTRCYGWLCVTGKLGFDAFTDDDERLASILAAQVGRIYENGRLYADLQQRTEELEVEVAERQRAEAALRTLNEELEVRVRHRTAQLEAANKELEAFSYSVSHDLRAPLRAIDGFSKALQEDCGAALDAPGRQYLERVVAATNRMAQLIDDLLGLARVTRSEMRSQDVDLSALAQHIAVELQKTQPERRAEFVITPGRVARGDAQLLRVALENLIGNAWKYTSKHATARIEFEAMPMADFRLQIAEGKHGEERWKSEVSDLQPTMIYFVRDDGAGFDMAYADKLFGAFQRLHASADFEGSGIGLATVQRIIHRHGGRIWAEGWVERGATFYFTLG